MQRYIYFNLISDIICEQPPTTLKNPSKSKKFFIATCYHIFVFMPRPGQRGGRSHLPGYLGIPPSQDQDQLWLPRLPWQVLSEKTISLGGV